MEILLVGDIRSSASGLLDETNTHLGELGGTSLSVWKECGIID